MRVGSVGCVLLMVAGLICSAGSASAAALPGNRANYVVSFGSLQEQSGSNWVRLGTYAFSSTGKVRSDTWAWSQGKPAARVGTGTVPSGNCSGTNTTVRPCEIKTAGGFLSPRRRSEPDPSPCTPPPDVSTSTSRGTRPRGAPRSGGSTPRPTARTPV
ncbi:hypothetical protein ACFQ0B_66960 [Nonomuraea thailandensis]